MLRLRDNIRNTQNLYKDTYIKDINKQKYVMFCKDSYSFKISLMVLRLTSQNPNHLYFERFKMIKAHLKETEELNKNVK